MNDWFFTSWWRSRTFVGGSDAPEYGKATAHVWALSYEDDGECSWVDFALWRVSQWDMTGAPGFFDGSAESDWPIEAPTVSGHVKWDGCTEVRMDEHFCGSSDLCNTLAALLAMYRQAQTLFAHPLQDERWQL